MKASAVSFAIRQILNRRVQASASAVLLAIGGVQAASAGIEQSVSFSIAPQKVSTALLELSRQAEIQIVMAGSIGDEIQTQGVEGRMSVRNALTKLLDGTALQFRVAGENIIGIERIVERRPQSAEKPSRVSYTRLAQADTSETQSSEVQEVIVKGLSFKYDTVESVNKMPLSIKDTPQSVKVISEDMLEFSGITKFEDVYKLDASTHTSHNQDQYVRTYFRGFKVDSSNAIKVDGFRMSGYPTLDLAPFERFEIIKGATSSIYGQAPIAGTLNAISKMPVAQRGGSLSLEGGSFDHYRGQLDVHGALTSSEKLSGRMVAAYEDEDSFLDFAFNERLVVAPSLRYEFTPSTTVTFMGQYQNAKFLPFYGIGAQFLGGDGTDPRNYVFPDVPRSRLPASPLSESERETVFTRLLVEHEFQNGWKLRAAAQNVDVDVLILGASPAPAAPDGSLPIYLYLRDAEDDYYSGEVNLFGNVEAFGREHTLFFGADYISDKAFTVGAYGSRVSGFNIFNPDYSLFPQPASTIGGYPGQWSVQANLKEYGFTAQAVIKATDRWSLIVEGRHSHVETARNIEFDMTSPSFGRTDFLPGESFTNTARTFLVGTTYAVTSATNLYASYGETFTPRNQFEYVSDDSPGRPVGPEEGEAYEVGVKGDLLAGTSLFWSVAAFDIARTNMTDTDYEHPGMGFVVLRGTQQSRGIEAELQGEILPGWDMYFSTAVMKNEFVDGPYDGFTSLVGPKFGISCSAAMSCRAARCGAWVLVAA